MADDDILARERRRELVGQPVADLIERRRDAPVVELALELDDRRVEGIGQTDPGEPDARIRRLAARRHDRHLVARIGHQHGVPAEHLLDAPDDRRRGVVDERDPHGPSPKHSASSASSRRSRTSNEKCRRASA